MKRFISIILIIMTLISLFCGCSKGETQEQDVDLSSDSIADDSVEEEDVAGIVGTWTYVGTMDTSTGSAATPPYKYVCSCEFNNDGKGYLNVVEDGELWDLQEVTWELSSTLDDIDIYAVYFDDGSEVGFSYLYSSDALSITTTEGDGMMLYQRDEDNSYSPIEKQSSDKGIVGRWKCKSALDSSTGDETDFPTTYATGILCNADGSSTMISYNSDANKVANLAVEWQFVELDSSGNEKYILKAKDAEFNMYYSPKDDLLMMIGSDKSIGFERE